MFNNKMKETLCSLQAQVDAIENRLSEDIQALKAISSLYPHSIGIFSDGEVASMAKEGYRLVYRYGNGLQVFSKKPIAHP